MKMVEQDFELKCRLLDQQVKDAAHQRRLEIIDLWFQGVGVAVGTGILISFVWLAKYAIDHGQANAGMLGGGVATVVALIAGNRYRKGQ